MTHTLDYAPASLRGSSPRWPLALIAIPLALSGAALAVYCAADGARSYLGTFGGCATGRSGAMIQVRFVTPLFLSLPTMAWWLSNRIGLGMLLCRACLWAIMAAWLTGWGFTMR